MLVFLFLVWLSLLFLCLGSRGLSVYSCFSVSAGFLSWSVKFTRSLPGEGLGSLSTPQASYKFICLPALVLRWVTDVLSLGVGDTGSLGGLLWWPAGALDGPPGHGGPRGAWVAHLASTGPLVGRDLTPWRKFPHNINSITLLLQSPARVRPPPAPKPIVQLPPKPVRS